MADKEEMKELLQAHVTLSSNANDLGKSILEKLSKDSDLSLDERWEIYERFAKNSPNFEVDGWVVHLQSVDDDKFTMYDHFYKDKYATVYYLDMLEIIISEEYDIDIEAFKKEVLSLKSTGFIYDW